MIERFPIAERNRQPEPELIHYKDGSHGFVLDTPGVEVRFDAGANGAHDPALTSFDTTGHEIGTIVGLACSDYDGNKTIFVAGDAYGDTVCRLDLHEGETRYAIYQDPDFNAALAESPMTIGARYDRLGERKLTKVYAEPLMNLGEDKATPDSGSTNNPLSIASRLIQARADRRS